MKNNENESNRKITVDIQGETDWVRFTYDTKQLDSLKNPAENLALLGIQLGALLDGDPINELSEEKKSEVSWLLARYVANLKAYEAMLSEGQQTLMITVFRIKNGKSTGYAIRVAGTFPEDLNETTLFVDGMPIPMDTHHTVLLYLLKTASQWYTEKYDKKSAFHDFIRESKLIEDKIEFRSQAHPNLQ